MSIVMMIPVRVQVSLFMLYSFFIVRSQCFVVVNPIRITNTSIRPRSTNIVSVRSSVENNQQFYFRSSVNLLNSHSRSADETEIDVVYDNHDDFVHYVNVNNDNLKISSTHKKFPLHSIVEADDAVHIHGPPPPGTKKKNIRTGTSSAKSIDQLVNRRMAITTITTIASSSSLLVLSSLLWKPSCHAITSTKTITSNRASNTIIPKEKVVQMTTSPLKKENNSIFNNNSNNNHNNNNNININTEIEILDPINITKVLEENKINITITNTQTNAQIYINQTSYEKITTPPSIIPHWLPKWMIQVPTTTNNNNILFFRQNSKDYIIESISDYKLFMASILAGSFTEIIRSTVLYPIMTIKTRIQYKPPSTSTLYRSYQKFVEGFVSLTKVNITMNGNENRIVNTRSCMNIIDHDENNHNQYFLYSQEERQEEELLPVQVLQQPQSQLQSQSPLSSQEHQQQQQQNKTLILNNNFSPHIKLTNLYAGIIPFLIASVPSAGIYFGIRDVSKRELLKLFQSTYYTFPLVMDDLNITLLSVLLGDIFCLAIKTPALLFSVRKQVATIENIYDDVIEGTIISASTSLYTSRENGNDYNAIVNCTNNSIYNIDNNSSLLVIEEPNHFFIKYNETAIANSKSSHHDTNNSTSMDNHINTGNMVSNSWLQPIWWEEILKDSWKQLPIIILTDLPYLLIKISLLRILATGHENIAEYTLLNTLLSCLCAVITTPFDVVRTRILVDSNGDPSDGLDGGLIVKDASYLERGGSLKNILFTINAVVDESEHGFRNLFAGWYERVLYLGLSIAWFDSIRTLSYLGVRDFLLLKL